MSYTGFENNDIARNTSTNKVGLSKIDFVNYFATLTN